MLAKRLDPHEEITLSVVCKGLTRDEFVGIYTRVQRELGARVAIRNPTPPAFDLKAVHEFVARFSPEIVLALGYSAKKAYDKIADVLAEIAKQRLDDREKRRRSVTIYGPDGKPLIIVETKPVKRQPEP